MDLGQASQEFRELPTFRARRFRPSIKSLYTIVSLASIGLVAITDGNIQSAVDDILTNPSLGKKTFGDITWWDTQIVTSLSYIFCALDEWPDCTATAEKKKQQNRYIILT